jgi:hypothetical protein
MRFLGATLGGVLLVSLPVLADEPRVDPEAPTVTIRVERAKVTLGEPFHVILTVIARPEVPVTLPASLALGDDFGELGRTETSQTEDDGTIKKTFDLTLAAWEIGPKTFPPVAVGYTLRGEPLSIETGGLALEVVSVVGKAKEELKPIAPPVSVAWRDLTLAWVLLSAAGGVLVILLGWRAVRRARRRKHEVRAQAMVDTRPPEDIALEKLQQLATSDLRHRDDRRPLYFAMTEIVREYLGRRYGFDALELTTKELHEALDARGALARGQLDAWLGACDLVKYARVPASSDEGGRALDGAVALIEASRPPPAPAPPAPTDAEVPGHVG